VQQTRINFEDSSQYLERYALRQKPDLGKELKSQLLTRSAPF
jgi:hypothetical protein